MHFLKIWTQKLSSKVSSVNSRSVMGVGILIVLFFSSLNYGIAELYGGGWDGSSTNMDMGEFPLESSASRSLRNAKFIP